MADIRELTAKTLHTLKEEGIISVGRKAKSYVHTARTVGRDAKDRVYKDVVFINGCDESVPHPARYRVTHQREQLAANNISTGEVLPKELDYPSDHYQLQAFGCVHVLSPSIFRYMEDERWTGKFSIIPFYVDICPKARIQGFPIDSENWFDVGKPETLAKAEAYYASL